MNIFSFTRKALVLCMTVALLSCSKEVKGPDTTEQSNVPMAFSPAVDLDAQSKALIESDAALQAYSISIIAKATKAGVSTTVFNNDRLDYASGNWSYGTPKFWTAGARYEFAAFTPFASTNSKIRIDMSFR